MSGTLRGLLFTPYGAGLCERYSMQTNGGSLRVSSITDEINFIVSIETMF